MALVETARKWADLYFGDHNNEAWKALHSPTVDYYDHAFMIHRIGIDATMGVRETWIGAHGNLEVEVQHIGKVENCDLVIADLVWSGRFAHDLIAFPGGPVALEPTGKSFVTPISKVFMFDNNGTISRIDEFYTKNWWDGVQESEYRIVK